MDSLLNKIKNEVRLEPHEKDIMRKRLVDFIEQHPVRAGAASVEEQHQHDNYRRSSILLGYQIVAFRRFAPALIAVILLGSGTSYAAEGALPGDKLYPIKIHLNESVKKIAAFSPEARARIQIQLANRRLLESEKLAKKGALTTVVQAELENAFLAHATQAREQIAAAKAAKRQESSEDATVSAVSIDLQLTLAVHEQILAELSAEGGTTIEPKLRSLLGIVRKENKKSGMLKAEREVRAVAQPSLLTREAAKEKLVATEQQLKVTAQTTQKLNDRIRPQTRATVQARNEVVSQIIFEAKTKLDAGASSEAVPLFEKARQLSQENKLFIEIKSEIERHDNDSSPKTEKQSENSKKPPPENATRKGDPGSRPTVPIQLELKTQLQL